MVMKFKDSHGGEASVILPTWLVTLIVSTLLFLAGVIYQQATINTKVEMLIQQVKILTERVYNTNEKTRGLEGHASPPVGNFGMGRP